MTARPTHGMVLAAGLGRRMRPITETLPKPLVPLAGKTLLDRALDQLQAVNVSAATVNLHYLSHMIEDHLAARSEPQVTFSRETDLLLETGGGVAAALPTLGHNPFYVVNADIAWEDGSHPALSRLAEFWRDEAMDALLLLHPVAQATGYDGVGDYRRNEEGLLTRRRDDAAAPYVFSGVQLLHPRLFVGRAGRAVLSHAAIRSGGSVRAAVSALSTTVPGTISGHQRGWRKQKKSLALIRPRAKNPMAGNPTVYSIAPGVPFSGFPGGGSA